jgi:hypothetical protein
MGKQLQKNKSFLGLVQEYTVRIPLIQRDYAQGRTDKQTEEIRKNFLKEMLSVLTTETESPLVLDFIYGSSVDKVFTPLDGQQRLTTLFLLHWYLCSKEDLSLLRTENGDAKFTYETRSTSKGFCNKLVNHSFHEIKERIENIKKDLEAKDKSENKEESKKEIETWTLSKGIKNESWFAWAWRKDPTIAGMLVMLDAMDKKLNDKNRPELWQKLKDENNIVFHLLPLEQFNLSDDLFVKMNARGKELSDFDKYKSTLEEQMLKNKVSEEIKEDWQSQENSLWMDLFWNTFYSELKKAMPDDEKEQKKIVENIEERYYVFLQRMKKFQLPDEGKYPFEFVLEVMKAIIYIDDNEKTKEGSSLISTVLWDVKDTLFKHFVEKEITYQSRVMFFALLQFFKYHEAEKVSNDDQLKKELDDWMRIIRNLAYNTAYNDSDDYEKALKSLENLALAIYKEQNSNVIAYFANDGNIAAFFSRDQVAEEKEKARQIEDNKDWKDENGKSWLEKIIIVENTAFFKGAIRFLYTDSDGKPNWELFDNRLVKSKEYFDKNGVIENYKKDALLLRILISGFSNWGEFWEITFNNTSVSWKNILTNKKWINAVCKLFNVENPSEFDFSTLKYPDGDENQAMVYTDLCNSLLLSSSINPDCKLNYKYGQYALYKPSANAEWNKYVIGHKRNQILSKAEDDGIIICGQRIPGVPYYWGWNINFEYNGKKYQWNRDRYIYSLTDSSERAKNANNDDIKISENDITIENFLSILEEKLQKLCPNSNSPSAIS